MLEVFTSPNCPKCHALKARLHNSGIVFTELNIEEEDSRLRLYMVNRWEVPVVVFDGRVVEFDDNDELIEKLEKLKELYDEEDVSK